MPIIIGTPGAISEDLCKGSWLTRNQPDMVRVVPIIIRAPGEDTKESFKEGE